MDEEVTPHMPLENVPIAPLSIEISPAEIRKQGLSRFFGWQFRSPISSKAASMVNAWKSSSPRFKMPVPWSLSSTPTSHWSLHQTITEAPRTLTPPQWAPRIRSLLLRHLLDYRLMWWQTQSCHSSFSTLLAPQTALSTSFILGHHQPSRLSLCIHLHLKETSSYCPPFLPAGIPLWHPNLAGILPQILSSAHPGAHKHAKRHFIDDHFLPSLSASAPSVTLLLLPPPSPNWRSSNRPPPYALLLLLCHRIRLFHVRLDQFGLFPSKPLGCSPEPPPSISPSLNFHLPSHALLCALLGHSGLHLASWTQYRLMHCPPSLCKPYTSSLVGNQPPLLPTRPSQTTFSFCTRYICWQGLS